MHRDRGSGKGVLANILHQIHTPRAPHSSPCQNVSLKIRLECNKTFSLNDTVSVVVLHSLLGLKRKCLFPFLRKCYTSFYFSKFRFCQNINFCENGQNMPMSIQFFFGFQPRFGSRDCIRPFVWLDWPDSFSIIQLWRLFTVGRLYCLLLSYDILLSWSVKIFWKIPSCWNLACDPFLANAGKASTWKKN